MAVHAVNVTTNPTAIAGLRSGTIYAIQNLGSTPVLVDVDSTAPANSDAPGILIPPRRANSDGIGLHYVRASSGESIYVWTQSGTASIRVTEAVQ